MSVSLRVRKKPAKARPVREEKARAAKTRPKRRAKSGGKLRRRSPLDRIAASKPSKKAGAVARASVAAKVGGVGSGVPRQYLEPNELRDFFKFLPPTSFWYPYFFIQYFFGCRLSEPALIMDDDVNVKKQTIVIRRLKKVQEKDGYRECVYPADARVLECVRVAQRWKEHKHTDLNPVMDNPFLFASGRRRKTVDVGAERLSQLRNQDGWQAVSRFTAHRMFQRIATHLKLPEHLRHSHVLRHTRAVVMLASGAEPALVQKLLGHSSLKMTLRYAEVAKGLKLSPEIIAMGLGL